MISVCRGPDPYAQAEISVAKPRNGPLVTRLRKTEGEGGTGPGSRGDSSKIRQRIKAEADELKGRNRQALWCPVKLAEGFDRDSFRGGLLVSSYGPSLTFGMFQCRFAVPGRDLSLRWKKLAGCWQRTSRRNRDPASH